MVEAQNPPTAENGALHELGRYQQNDHHASRSVVCGLALIGALLDSGLAAYGHVNFALRVMAILCLLGGVAGFLDHGGRRITAAGIYCLTAGVMTGSGGWYWSITPGTVSLHALFAAAASVFISSVLMYWIFWTGLRDERRSTQPDGEGRPIPPRVIRGMRGVGIVLAIAGFGASVVYRGAGQLEGIGTLPQSAAEVGVVLLTASIVFGSRRTLRSPVRLTAIAAILLVFLLVVFSGGGRLRVATLVISLAVLAQYRNRAPFKALAIAAIVPTILAFGIIGQSRIHAASASYTPTAAGLGSLVNPLYVYGQVIDGHLSHAHGSSLEAETVVLVPRTVWPGKPVQLGRTLAVDLRPDAAARSNLSLVVGPQGEWYFNFGWVGIALMALVIGLGIRWLDRLFVRRVTNSVDSTPGVLGVIVLAILVGSISDLAWGGTATWFVRNIQRALLILPFLLWAYGTSRASRRSLAGAGGRLSGLSETARPNCKRKIRDVTVQERGPIHRQPSDGRHDEWSSALGLGGEFGTPYLIDRRSASTVDNVGIRRLRRIGSRATAAFADQSLSSLTNFVVSLAAVRYLATPELGIFTLAYFGAQLVLTFVRSLVLEPLTIRFTTVSSSERRLASRSASGTSLAIGLLVAIAALLPLLASRGTPWLVFAATGCIMPILLVQDAWRFHLFAAGRPWGAATNDGICLVFTIGATAAALEALPRSPQVFLLAWGVGTAFGALVGMAQTKVVPNVLRAVTWLSRHRDLGPHLAIGNGLEFGASQAAFGIVGAVAGVAPIGQLGSARTLMTPATTLTTGMNLFAVPEARRFRLRGRARLVLFSGVVSLLVAAGIVGFSLFLHFMPDHWGHVMFGRNWSDAKALLLPTAIWTAAAGARGGAAVGLRALERGRRIAVLSAITAPAIIVGASVGAALDDARGAAWGFAIVYCVAVIGWWLVYLFTGADHGRVAPPPTERPDETIIRSGAYVTSDG